MSATRSLDDRPKDHNHAKQKLFSHRFNSWLGCAGAVLRPARGVWAASLSAFWLCADDVCADAARAGLAARADQQSALRDSRLASPTSSVTGAMTVPTTPRDIARAQRDQQRAREKAQRDALRGRAPKGATTGEDSSEAAPMVSRRVLLLLPLRLGAGWSANPIFTRGLLPRASQALKDSLRGTESFPSSRFTATTPFCCAACPTACSRRKNWTRCCASRLSKTRASLFPSSLLTSNLS